MANLELSPLVDALVSHAMTTGLFDRVNAHDVVNAPGKGVTCTVTWQNTRPAPRNCGLAVTTAVVKMLMRPMVPNEMQPRDAIDPTLHDAVDAIFAKLSADFTLDGLVRNIDLLGQVGPGLTAQGGYMQVDTPVYRVADINVDLIVDDVYPQAP